jgi:glycosyltransferase involved in cell wall biosynthesis
MRLAHITYTYFPLVGGGDVYVEDLRQALAKRGHEQVVLARASQETTPWFAPVPNPLRGMPAEFWTHALGLVARRRLLRSQDAVIAHYPVYALAALAVVGAASSRRFRRTRVIGLSHGVTWDDRPGALRSRVKRTLARAAFHRCAAFVANDSNFLREMGLDIAPGERFFEQVAPGRWFIPNCVDTERFRPGAGWERLRAMRPIVVPRNLFFNRGVHLAIGAFARFRRAHPDTRLVIVGAPSRRDYARMLRRLVRDLDLRDDVLFWGPVAHADMPAVYASAEMVVIPSVAGEGTSLSALEAMACGVATISTVVGGLVDLPSAHCAPDVLSMSDAMLRVYEERGEIGALQRKQVRAAFNRSRWEEAWAQVVDSVA